MRFNPKALILMRAWEPFAVGLGVWEFMYREEIGPLPSLMSTVRMVAMVLVMMVLMGRKRFLVLTLGPPAGDVLAENACLAAGYLGEVNEVGRPCLGFTTLKGGEYPVLSRVKCLISNTDQQDQVWNVPVDFMRSCVSSHGPRMDS